MQQKERVVLFGASGTLGYAAFKQLWERRKKYDIVLLLLPHPYEKKLFKPYEKTAGIAPIFGKGVVYKDGFKIVWGDAANDEDVLEAVQGADYVLNAMAYISPMADYYPERARKVNIVAVQNILDAIRAQPNGTEHICYVHIGTVAETGDRLPNIHLGRVGDPLNPSIFDYYAITKIEGERLVLESDLRYWVSLRMTYLMPTEFKRFFKLMDPIMFHMPVNTLMENVTDRDAGLGLFNILGISRDSDFWRRVYNMGGGAGMRIDAVTYFDKIYQLLGLSGIKAVSCRNWYALRNFHMQFYEDSYILNEYLHYWNDDFESYWKLLRETIPPVTKTLAFLCRSLPFFRKIVEKITFRQLKTLAEHHRNGPLYWVKNRVEHRITAFFKDDETYQAIPDWDTNNIQSIPIETALLIDHGYDKTKDTLAIDDLKKAALFRGGFCISNKWNGDLYETLHWKCAFDHQFSAKVYSILKAGHWCPVCVNPPWNFDEQARKNPFFAQVWNNTHDLNENHVYEEELIQDIAGADLKFQNRSLFEKIGWF